jgi:DNA-binding MarR family transcriptional regulator
MLPKQEHTGLLISAARRRIKQVVLDRVQAHGLSPSQFWMVVALSEHPGCSLRQLAGQLRLDDPTASRVLAALARAGHVHMEQDPDDRRRLRARLSSSGKALARKLVPIATEVRGTVDSALEARERETLRALLIKVITHIDRARGLEL